MDHFASRSNADVAAEDAPKDDEPEDNKQEKSPLLSKLDSELVDLHGAYAAAMAAINQAEGRASNTAVETQESLLIVDDYVVVDIVAKNGDGAALLVVLEALGLQHGTAFGGMVSGQFPIAGIDSLLAVDNLNHARVSHAMVMTGSVDNQGDVALGTDDARTAFSVSGDGISVGVLSDSFDVSSSASTSYADDIATGDLPDDVVILDDSAGGFLIDEGRAMAQLIHDIAPDADLLFHTAFNGQADFAQGILDLAAAGADIIVDDIIYFAEPMFQDGIIAQAVDQVFAQGVAYFSSAGNQARESYESEYRGVADAALDALTFTNQSWHDFDPGSGVDTLQSFSLAAGESVRLAFQWDQPFFDASSGSQGSSSDVDIYLLNDSGTTILERSIVNNLGGDPVEFIEFVNTSGSTQNYNIAIALFSGPVPGLIKYVDFDGGTTDAEFFTDSGTSYGHASAEGGQGVGASAFFFTPAFGVNPPQLNDFSSAGGTPILFDASGNRLANPEFRERVDFTAPDGGNTTFFGSDSGADSDTFPNFFGTSAAAPNAAALAALMLEANPNATPADIYTALQDSAIDIQARANGLETGAGFDEDSGTGLIVAETALNLILGGGSGMTINGTPGNDTFAGGAGNDTLRGFAGNDTLNGLGGNDTINGGSDADVLNGGGGNDVIFGSGGMDTLMGDAGFDQLDGGPGRDTLNGGSGNDMLNGGGGADTFIGEAGDDTIDGGALRDLFDLSGQSDSVTIDLESGAASGIGIGTDTVTSIERVVGGAGDDHLTGTNSVGETLEGGGGNDTLNGGNGSDTLRGEAGEDDLIGAGGNDNLNGGSGNDILDGGGGADVLLGSGGDDQLFGRARDDSLDGGAGRDTLDGGDGNDVLTGGGGVDTFVFNAGDAGSDTVADFTMGETVQLFGFGYANASAAAGDFVQSGSNVIFNNGAVSVIFQNASQTDVLAAVDVGGAVGNGFTAMNVSPALGLGGDGFDFAGLSGLAPSASSSVGARSGAFPNYFDGPPALKVPEYEKWNLGASAFSLDAYEFSEDTALLSETEWFHF